MTDTDTGAAEFGGADPGVYVQVEASQRRHIADGEPTARARRSQPRRGRRSTSPPGRRG